MPGLIRKPVKHVRSRRRNLEANRPQPATPILISSSSKAVNNITLTFDQPVTLKGLPAYTTNLGGVTLASAIKTAPNVVSLTFSAAVFTATTLNIPFRDPAIRNASGGFVTSNSFGI